MLRVGVLRVEKSRPMDDNYCFGPVMRSDYL